MPPLLRVDRLSAGYGVVPVLHDVSLAVEPRETVAVLGANGAGKSTLVNTVAGVLRPSAGSVHFDGADATGLKPEALAGRGLALVRQGRSVFPHMTVQENLDMGAYLVRDRQRGAERLEAAFAMFPILKERRRQAAGAMSGGEQKMLEIARALMKPMSLLVLDEPSLGLAPIVMERIFSRFAAFNADGIAVLLVEQNAAGALAVSRRAYVLELGRIRLEGPSGDLARDPEVRRHYLGMA
jgi:branched-chain amino acid transport system ATP-binding protein